MFLENPSIPSSRLDVMSFRRPLTNYISTLHNIPEELKYYLHRGGSLKSHTDIFDIMLFGLRFKVP